jgi:DAPG hydrolase PhiG domain
MSLKIPELRAFNWQMKTTASAITSLAIDNFGALHMYIQHDVVKGVTPKMLEWWFRNIGGDMEFQSKTYSKYQVWHPYDHIHWNLANQLPNNFVGVGSKFHIVEAFGANKKMLIDVTEEVIKLDEAGVTLSGKRLGIEISNLSHQFITVENGTKYVSHLKIGSCSLLGKFFINPVIRRFIFNEQKGYAWIKHNIEEVGNFEFFLPALFKEESCAAV